MSAWQVTAAAGAGLAALYLALAAGVLGPLSRRGRVGTDRLGLATAGIFFTCAVHHASLAVLPLLAALGADLPAGRALQAGLTAPQAVLDVTALVVAATCLGLRRGAGARSDATPPFDTPEARRRRAIELNDDVVQGLTVAQMALAVGEPERSQEAIAATLAAARAMMSDLLGDAEDPVGLRPGDLVRSQPAHVGEG